MEASLWLTLILITGPFAGALAASDSSSSQTAGSSKYDCDRGCPLNTYPVCGSDGEWYQNACMAFCAKMTVDSTAAACAGAPMPFEDAKPGPHGAESGRPGGVTRLIDKGVINAFRQEGLRYVGRIRLAREMGPRPKTIGSNMRMPEPQDDGSGHWRVATLRCTADGDIYKGTISVPMAAMDLKAFEPNRLLGNLFKGMSSRSRAPEKPATEQLLQESGSYSAMDPSLSDIPGMFDPSRQPEALPEFHTEQQRPQWQRPLNYLWGVWGKMKDAADSLTALVRPASVDSPGNEAGSTVEVAGAGSSSSSDRQEVASAVEEEATLWTAPNAAEESAAPGGAHTISFEPAKALSAAAAYADGPFSSSDSGDVVGGPGVSRSISSDANAEALDESAADAGLLSEVMGDIADDGSIGAAYSVGNATTAGNRRLLEIINGDDRFFCEKGYPYTAIGQIQVVDNTGLYICTGVLIRPNKVLTAAHCVWNTKRNAFYYNLNFAPGRYRHDGKMVNPWGVVPWKSVTVFDAFKKDPATWDVAVVTLSKNLGSVTGYMGMAAGCSSNTDLTLAGYPQDQAQGTCMANTCRVPYLDCNALTNIHTCDTIMGMSGSPLWDSKNRIRMIHVAGIAGRPENRATTVTQFLINTISKW